MAGFFDGLLDSVQNPLFLGGVGLMTDGGQGLQQGLMAGNQFAQQKKRQKSQEAMQNGLMAMEGLSDQDKQILSSSPELAADYLGRMYANKADPMADIKRQTAEAELGMLPLKRQQIESQIAQNRAQIEQGRGGRYGLQPVFGQDANGNPVVMQLGPGGEAVQTRLPDGVRLDLGVKAREGAAGKVQGTAQGEAKVNLPMAEYNAKKITTLLDGVLSDPYLPNMTGPAAGRMPNISGPSNRVQSKIDQIQGKTFLQAYESLKGSGQITEIEGAKAESSLQRLQNTRVGAADYANALREFRQDVADLAEITRAKANGGYAPQQQQMTAPPQQNGSWSIKRLD